MQQRFDPQQMIVSLLAVKLLRTTNGELVLTNDEMRELAKFTLRLEILQPQDPATSPIKCSLITVEDAAKFLQEMAKSKRG